MASTDSNFSCEAEVLRVGTDNSMEDCVVGEGAAVLGQAMFQGSSWK